MSRERLDDLTGNALGISFDRFMIVLRNMNKLRELLGDDGLYVQRICTLASSTNKSDVADCKYVQRSAEIMLSEDLDKFSQATDLMSLILKDLPE